MNEALCRVKFKLVAHLIIIPVYVNRKGPYEFWLDTGSPYVIISKQLAREQLR